MKIAVCISGQLRKLEENLILSIDMIKVNRERHLN